MPRTDDRGQLEGADAETVRRVSQAILETVFSKAVPEAVSANAPLAAASRDALAECRAASKARAEAEAAFKEHLSPKAEELWRAFSDAEFEERGAAIDLHVAELARHLPGLAPAIHLTWAHVIDCRLERVGTCCTDGVPVEP